MHEIMHLPDASPNVIPSEDRPLVAFENKLRRDVWQHSSKDKTARPTVMIGAGVIGGGSALCCDTVASD